MTDMTWWAWLQSHGTAVIAVTGAALTALVLAAIWRALARGSLARALRAIAIPLVLLYEAQGLFLVTLRVHVPRDLAFVLAGVTTAVILTFAAYAHEHHKRTGNLGPAGRMMWYVAVPMGLIVAASSSSLAAVGLRIVLPLLSVAAFRVAYLPDEPDGAAGRQGSWRLTPRRIGVALGLLDPADTDLITVHAERRVRQLTAHAAGYHRGARALRPWHRRRFERLALTADDAMITEAARRVGRVHAGLASTHPDHVALAPSDVIGSAPADVIGDDLSDSSAEASGDGIADGRRERIASAVAKVRRKGAGNATDDEIRAAIRELAGGGSPVTVYKIAKELKGPKGTIGDKRAGRLLAETEAESRVVVPLGKHGTR